MYSIIICHSLLATFIFSSYFKQIEDYTKLEQELHQIWISSV